MNQNKPKPAKHQRYEPPRVLASYEKEELEQLIRPEGGMTTGSPGCGGGSILVG